MRITYGGLTFDDEPSMLPGTPLLSVGALGWDRTREIARSGKFGLVILCANDVEMPLPLPSAVSYHHVRITDRQNVIPSDHEVELALCAARLAVWGLRMRIPTLVGCAMGLNRSALVAALALRMASKIQGRFAVHALRRARGEFALSNHHFERIVREHDLLGEF